MAVSLTCTPERRVTAEEVIVEVLACTTARVHISPDPALLHAPPTKAKQDAVALPSQLTSHPSVCVGTTPSNATGLRVAVVVKPYEMESPPIVDSGKYYAIVRGRRVGVFTDSL